MENQFRFDFLVEELIVVELKSFRKYYKISMLK